MRAPPGHANRIRAIVSAFVNDHPDATFEQVCKHIESRGLVIVDREMLREFLDWKGK